MKRAMAGLAGLAMMASAACERTDEAADAAAGEIPAATAAAADEAAPVRLTDAEIAAVVVAANGIDVRYGELALERASDEGIRRFAQTMIADHSAVNRNAVALVSKLNVTPAENELSRALERGAAETREALSKRTGAEFDRAYIANEVSYHRAVLEALDQTLIPSASNAELKQTLIGVRPLIEAHMRHAMSLESALSGT